MSTTKDPPKCGSGENPTNASDHEVIEVIAPSYFINNLVIFYGYDMLPCFLRPSSNSSFILDRPSIIHLHQSSHILLVTYIYCSILYTSCLKFY
jgi:hypothetical protein